MFIAFVPLSIISILVKTPIVLSPEGSKSLAIFNASEVEISEFAGITQRIIVVGSEQYLNYIVFKMKQFIFYLRDIPFVIFSISSFWSVPFKGILVIPGKSINVKSGQELEYIVNIIGSSTIPLFCPATSSVY